MTDTIIIELKNDFDNLLELRKHCKFPERFDDMTLCGINLVIKNRISWFREYKEFLKLPNHSDFPGIIGSLRFDKLHRKNEFTYLWSARKILRKYNNYVGFLTMSDIAMTLNAMTLNNIV